MKKLLLINICLYFLVLGCDSRQGYVNVTKEFPNAEVKYLPGESYKFLVKKENGDIYYVIDDGSISSNVKTKWILMFSANKKNTYE